MFTLHPVSVSQENAHSCSAVCSLAEGRFQAGKREYFAFERIKCFWEHDAYLWGKLSVPAESALFAAGFHSMIMSSPEEG